MDNSQPSLIHSLDWNEYLRFLDMFPKNYHPDAYEWFWGHLMKIDIRDMDHTFTEDELKLYKGIAQRHQLHDPEPINKTLQARFERRERERLEALDKSIADRRGKN